MGCTQSRIENEEAVNRCKERRQFMKDAVASRNAFAAAHSSYAVALKNTGVALSGFAQGEVHNSNQSTHPASPGRGVGPSVVPPSQTPFGEPAFRPPPPPDSVAAFDASPLQRAVSMPEIKQKSKPIETTATIHEEEEDEEIESRDRLVTRKSRSYKTGTGGSSRGSRREAVEEERAAPPTLEMPPQQASSQHDPTWRDFHEYLFPSQHSVPGTTLADVEEMRVEKGEVERKAFEETAKRREEVVEQKREEVVMEQKVVAVETDKMVEKALVATAKGMKKGGRAGPSTVEKRVAKGNLSHIFADIDDDFLKASESAQEVSKLLEATKLHYHSNFADNRGHIDHSARVMRVITWNRSFRGDFGDRDVKDDFDLEENETHATVLDKLLAWEKKLYDEVKAGELMKFEYQRKVATLNKLKKRGTNSEALEKAKAAVSHLHTRYIVDMQSLDSTVSEINRLRDQQLYPKLVQLVDAMATMWETMLAHHENQASIVKALRALDPFQFPKETSEHRRVQTYELWAVVKDWHLQFCKLIDHQKDYIKALKGWLKLNLVPIESNLKEKVSSPPRVQSPPIERLLLAWHDHLDKLQDGVARAAMFNFAAVIEAIKHHQDDEIKLKLKCEETRKELTKKRRQFEDWHHKYRQLRTSEELDPERTDNNQNDAVAERHLAVEVLEKRLKEEEEAYQTLCIQVREKSFVSLRTCLPELFRAMSEIALSFSSMYNDLRSRSNHKKGSQNSS
ncbi:hypothetical protein SLE2022_310990 [Rubroshorea leprosula]